MWKKLEQIHRQITKEQDTNVKIARMNIYKQAGLAAAAIAITLVLVFAMSVAWYSNVLHTENMVFKTASWNFDFEGQIKLGTASQPAAPGDSGYIQLELTNTGKDPISVLVNVTKNTTALSEEMKQRLYFYVDTNQLINGETVDKVYINETDAYRYTVLGGSSLTLSETYNNAPALKWEWVYDVLGYYVKGTITKESTIIEDYLRPVTYEYEQATYDESDGAGGAMLTVDGTTTAEQFVTSLLQTDGYAGNTYATPVNGYYPVSVDADGNGIWLYLCTQQEIESSTNWDTYISNQVAAGTEYTFSARLLISGQ